MRKNKIDWFETGLKVLGDEGIKGLTIEKMMLELDVTKGSFYHHFKDVTDFQNQMVTFWADQYFSTSPIQTGNPKEMVALLDSIIEETFANITKPEIAIRVWAQLDENVRDLVEKVDTLRKAFVHQVFLSIVTDSNKAELMTDILSTMLVGSLTVLPRIPPERVVSLYKEFKHVYGI